MSKHTYIKFSRKKEHRFLSHTFSQTKSFPHECFADKKLKNVSWRLHVLGTAENPVLSELSLYVRRDLQLSLLSTENVVSAEVLSKQISVPLGEHSIKWSSWGLLGNLQISCFPSSFGTSRSFSMWSRNRNPEDAWMILQDVLLAVCPCQTQLQMEGKGSRRENTSLSGGSQMCLDGRLSVSCILCGTLLASCSI